MPNSLIKHSQDYLFNHLLKQWLKHGINAEQGYSVESLNHDWSVNPVGRIRLLTQCRQLYTFSHAFIETKQEQWHQPLTPLFEFILTHYWLDDAWMFSLDDDLNSLLKKPWSIISYGFLHADFLHILMNLLVLYYIGNLFLEYFTQKQLLSFYILGTLFGGILYIFSQNYFPLSP